MSDKDKDSILEDDIIDQMESELDQIDETEKLEEQEKKESEKQNSEDKTKEILAKTLADFDNYKKRVERDKKDMIFFLKADILKNILPRIDDKKYSWWFEMKCSFWRYFVFRKEALNRFGKTLSKTF